MFIDRQVEKLSCNSMLGRSRPSAAQFVLLYGRRVDKPAL